MWEWGILFKRYRDLISQDEKVSGDGWERCLHNSVNVPKSTDLCT